MRWKQKYKRRPPWHYADQVDENGDGRTACGIPVSNDCGVRHTGNMDKYAMFWMCKRCRAAYNRFGRTGP